MPLRLLLPLTLLLSLAPASIARAEFFPGEPIDGPAEISKVGDVDVSRDGSGAVAYVRSDGGVDHIFLSRLISGTWQAPERLDAALPGAGSQPVVAASEGGRLLVAFVNGGAVYATARPAGGTGFTELVQIASAGSDPSVDMSINGVSYLSFTAPGASAADVRVARFERDTPNGAVLADPVDVDPARNAGDGSKRSKVVISADGTALVVWGEDGADGHTHVYGRRVFGTNLSKAPQDLTLDALNGAAGGAADLPDVDVEDDSSFAWVVFRQAFAEPGGTHSRAIARRLVGSQFEPPVVVDGQGDTAAENATSPRIDLNGRGQALTGVGGSVSGGAFAAFNKNDIFAGAATRLDTGGSSVDPMPQPAISENADAVLAWRQRGGPADPVTIHARRYDDDPKSQLVAAPGPDKLLTNPAFGGVDVNGGFDAATNRVGDVVVVFIQVSGSERRLVSATFDRPPGAFSGFTTQKWRNFARPPVKWAASLDLWGPLTYRVLVDNQPVGETTGTSLTPLNVVPDGEHRWRVVATDRRGQAASTKSRLLRVDATPPALTVKVSGTRKRGKTLKLAAKASDAAAVRSSGVKLVKIDWGDGSTVVIGRKSQHRYGKNRTFTIRVSATDRAGNVAVIERKVRIKK